MKSHHVAFMGISTVLLTGPVVVLFAIGGTAATVAALGLTACMGWPLLPAAALYEAVKRTNASRKATA